MAATTQSNAGEATGHQDTETEDSLTTADPQDAPQHGTYQIIDVLRLTTDIPAHIGIHENDHAREITNNHAQSTTT